MVQSPFYNQREDVRRLFALIDQELGRLKMDNLERRKVFSAVFPGEEFQEQQLRYTQSFLLKIVKTYLAQTEYVEESIQQQLYLSRALQKRGLDKYAERELRQANELLEKEKWRNSQYHYQRYQLAQEELSYSLLQKRSGALRFQLVSEELTISYIADILRHSCSLHMSQSMSEHSYDLKLLAAVLQMVESSDYLDLPAVAVYFQVYRALHFLENQELELSEAAFREAKQLINQHWHQFPSYEIREIYLFATNYCITRLNKGERRFIQEAFDLFRSGLANKALLNRGLLSSFSYKNITRLGIALGEDDWVEQFLATYKKFLHPRERENTWRYNLAFYYFQKPDYEKAMRLLQQVEFKDTLNNLDARRMLLRSYFELQEYAALDSLLDSFSTYIYRQKSIGYHRENYTNLIRFVKKIIHFKDRNTEEWQQLWEEVQRTPMVAERSWLLEQLEEGK